MKIDLKKLSDSELLALKERVQLEENDRKNGVIWHKSSLPFTEERYLKETTLLNHWIEQKGFNFDLLDTYHSPVFTIQNSVFTICDYILGNFKIVKNNKISRETSMLKIDDKESYCNMYHELYDVIDKWTEENLNKIGE